MSFIFLVYHPPHGPKWDITYLLHPDPRDITWVVFPNLGDIPVPFLPDRRNITAILKITHGQPVGGMVNQKIEPHITHVSNNAVGDHHDDVNHPRNIP